MEWITPKTDWAAREDGSGNYIGDYFNITDYNRIKNNIEFLGEVAHQFWPVFVKAMPDRNYQEYPYADEINTLSTNLEAINQYVNCEIGSSTTYEDNGNFIGYEDLNRIESACLKIYEAMHGLYIKPSALPFRMGARYYPLKNPQTPPRKLRLPFNGSVRLGGTYYPFKPGEIEKIETTQKRLKIKLGSSYFPFRE